MSEPDALAPSHDTSGPAETQGESAVKAALTARQLERIVERQRVKIQKLETALANRPAKRPRREVETMDYVKAAARFIRSAGDRVADSDEHELAALISLEPVLAKAIARAVEGQRAIGRSWDHIAQATGASRQAAYQRWGKP